MTGIDRGRSAGLIRREWVCRQRRERGVQEGLGLGLEHVKKESRETCRRIHRFSSARSFGSLTEQVVEIGEESRGFSQIARKSIGRECSRSPPRRSGHMSGRAAGEQKQGLFWRTIRAAHVVHRRRMHPGMIALEPATLPARRARDNPWFSLRHSLIQIHVIGFIAFRPIPGMPRGGVLPPTPVLAPGSALGSRPRVALSSAQVTSV